VTDLVDDIAIDRPPAAELIDEVEQTGLAGRLALNARAEQLERQAQRLHELSRAVHADEIGVAIATAVKPADGSEGDLLRAALLLAALDNDELDVDFYVQAVADLAQEFQAAQPAEISAADKLAAFHRFLFEEQGFTARG
jgi:hypothetical protein